MIDLARRHSERNRPTDLNIPSVYNWNDDEDYADDNDFHLQTIISNASAASTTTQNTPTATAHKAEPKSDSSAPRTYLYCFQYGTGYDVYPRWTDGVHADDLAYVFGAPLAGIVGGAAAVGWAGGRPTIEPFSSQFSRADRILSELIMRYWVGFIRTG